MHRMQASEHDQMLDKTQSALLANTCRWEEQHAARQRGAIVNTCNMALAVIAQHSVHYQLDQLVSSSNFID